MNNHNSTSNLTGQRRQVFSTDQLNTNSNVMQTAGGDHNEFVFNPTKDLGTRNTADGAAGISMVTP